MKKSQRKNRKMVASFDLRHENGRIGRSRRMVSKLGGSRPDPRAGIGADWLNIRHGKHTVEH